MDRDEGEDTTIYKVVVKDHSKGRRREYSIWPTDREHPLGWSETGKTGTKAEGGAYIDKRVEEDKFPPG